MKIAILMSTYNGEKYIEKQLESIAKQTFKEYITLYVRDDGSSDKTVELIEQWCTKLNIIFYKGKNVGPARSFWDLFTNTEIQAE